MWAQTGDASAIVEAAGIRRELGDLLEVADGGVAPHVVLLLDVFKFRGVDVHPSQHLGWKGEQPVHPLPSRHLTVSMCLLSSCPAKNNGDIMNRTKPLKLRCSPGQQGAGKQSQLGMAAESSGRGTWAPMLPFAQVSFTCPVGRTSQSRNEALGFGEDTWPCY